MRRQRLAVLGSTGSIGTSTLDVVARHPERFEVVALTAATQVDAMLAQCERFRPRVAVMASAPHAAELAQKIKQKGIADKMVFFISFEILVLLFHFYEARRVIKLNLGYFF